MYGSRTAAGTCQEIRIPVRGSAPKARWRPKGTAEERSVDRRAGADDVLGAGESAPHPVSSPPAATAPADTSVRRLVSFVRRYSYCSAMLIPWARRGGMPTSGVSMRPKLPCSPNACPAYG